jgi:hypothetical protein
MATLTRCSPRRCARSGPPSLFTDAILASGVAVLVVSSFAGVFAWPKARAAAVPAGAEAPVSSPLSLERPI